MTGQRILRDRWGEPAEPGAVPDELPLPPSGDRATLAQQLLRLYDERGALHYGEGVSQREHALQAAALARAEGADDALVTAALLHDIGHLLHKRGEDVAARGIDAKHEAIGAGWLARHFGPAVCEPVRLHVAAKRYLCAVEPGYEARLSPASTVSIALQGGRMRTDEAAAFEALPFAAAALRLRRWDEAAKDIDLATPAFESFIPHILAAPAA
ncbi:MAG: phosphonate degradation HD-domain oxygenase [Kiloniellales bacterium]